MQIKHAKVSGLANPADPALVGGEDWDDAHAITGARFVGKFRVVRPSGGVQYLTNVFGCNPTIYDYDNNEVWVTMTELVGVADADIYVLCPLEWYENTSVFIKGKYQYAGASYPLGLGVIQVTRS